MISSVLKAYIYAVLEIEKVQTTGRIPSREQKYADIYREKPLRISQRVLVPIREHPKVFIL